MRDALQRWADHVSDAGPDCCASKGAPLCDGRQLIDLRRVRNTSNSGPAPTREVLPKGAKEGPLAPRRVVGGRWSALSTLQTIA
jgi:hypothetical protein